METQRRTLTPDLFQPVVRNAEEAERIGGKPIGFWGDAIRRLVKNKTAVISAVLIFLAVVMAIIGPWLTPYGPDAQNFSRSYADPSSNFWFGTDKFGRSMFDRVWLGTRVSLYIALLATVIDLGVGMLYGAISAYYGGWVDNVMQRIVEVITGIPIIVVAILMLIVFNPGILSVTLAISIAGWTGSARLIRGQVLRLKEQEFFLASRTLGAGSYRLILKHLIPNVLYLVIITLMFTAPSAVFFEAFLSFIGLGIQPPDASLGALISDGANGTTLRYYPYLLIFPGIVLCILTICFRLLGDGLRDALDPRMRQ